MLLMRFIENGDGRRMKSRLRIKKISVIILLILFLLISSCYRSRGTVTNDKEYAIIPLEVNILNEGVLPAPEDYRYEESQVIDFITLPNGMLVDKRIPLNIADTIVRRIEAIENGDLSAFHATFEGHDVQDGVGMNRQTFYVIHFFGDSIGFNFNFDINWDKARYKAFSGEYSPVKRNLWAFVEKIKLIETEHGSGIGVNVLSYEGETLVYYIGVDLLPSAEGFLGGSFSLEDLILHTSRNFLPCCLLGCLVWGQL